MITELTGWLTIAVRRLWRDFILFVESIAYYGSYCVAPRQRRFYGAND